MGSSSGPGLETGPPVWTLRGALAVLVVWASLFFAVQFVAGAAAALILTPPPRTPYSLQTHLLGWQWLPVLLVACSVLTWALTFQLIATSLKGFPAGSFRRGLGLTAPLPAWSLVAAVPLGVLVCLLGEVIAGELLTGDEPNPFEPLMKSHIGQAAISALALIVAPLAEEIFFRGFLYPPIERLTLAAARSRGIALFYGTALAVTANALVFSLAHLPEYLGNIGYLLAVLLLGILAASLRAWTGSVWPGMVAHFFFNGSSLLLYFLQP